MIGGNVKTLEESLKESPKEFVDQFTEERGESKTFPWTWKQSLTVCLAVITERASIDGKKKAHAELQRMAIVADQAEMFAERSKNLQHAIDEVRAYCELVEWIDHEGMVTEDAPGFVSLVAQYS